MRVARAFGQDPIALGVRPFAAAAWTFLTLMETEEFDLLQDDGAALRQASLTAIAFHEPRKLEGEHRSLLQRMRAETSLSVSEAKDRALKMLARMRKERVMADVEDADGR